MIAINQIVRISGNGFPFLVILSTSFVASKVHNNFNHFDLSGNFGNGGSLQILEPYTDGTPVESRTPVPPPPWKRLLPQSSKTIIPPSCTILNDIPRKTSEMEIINGRNQTSRNGLINQRYRWIKNFDVQPDPAFEKWERDVINNAMYNLWQVIPCIRFGIYHSNITNISGDYVRIVKGTNNGCNSYVGRQGGKQVVNLESPGCITVGIVMHELLHALGFYHEHCRHDRDEFLDIYWDNIYPEYKFAFDKQSTQDTSAFGVPYNYKSIMHYDNRAFSKNGQMTMVGKNGQSIGSVGELQQTDIQKLKAMYKC